MDIDARNAAAERLAAARRTGSRLPALADGMAPATIAEAHAVQDALANLLDEPVAGWKVAGLAPGEVMRGAILRSRRFDSPARIRAADMPLLGVEAEIAFHFDRALPAREAEYGYGEVSAAVTALPAIEVVDSRFANYRETPVLHRLCDFMSNGALVCGPLRPDWRDIDLATLAVTLRDGEAVLASSVGGHGNRDPLLPAVALANELRSGPGIDAGQIVTTRTFTGLLFVSPGSVVAVEFAGFGRAEVTFVD